MSQVKKNKRKNLVVPLGGLSNDEVMEAYITQKDKLDKEKKDKKKDKK